MPSQNKPFLALMTVALFCLVFSGSPVLGIQRLGYDTDFDGLWDDVPPKLQAIASPASNDYAIWIQLALALQGFSQYGVRPGETPQYSAQLVRALECAFYTHFYDKETITQVYDAVLSTEDRKQMFSAASAQAALMHLPGPNPDGQQWYASCDSPVQPIENWPPPEQLMMLEGDSP